MTTITRLDRLPSFARSRLADLDVWNITETPTGIAFQGDLPGSSIPRAYLCNADDGTIFADNPQPMSGLFTLGGPRAAIANDRKTQFPYHLFSANDDINHVGMAGYETAPSQIGMGVGREVTTDAIALEHVLKSSAARKAALPISYARTETASAATALDLGASKAIENLEISVQNWINSAQAIGKSCQLQGCFVDYCVEDVSETVTDYHSGVLAILEKLSKQVFAVCDHAPAFFMVYESGTQNITDSPALDALRKLIFDFGEHTLNFFAPGYMFELNKNGWFTEQGRSDRGMMLAHAIMAGPKKWHCPTALHAEYEDGTIRVTFKAGGDLVLDDSDLFDAGRDYGFHLIGVENDVEITDVSIARSDSKAVLLKCSTRPFGRDVRLAYAAMRTPNADRNYPANAGSLRDDWSCSDAGADHLKRWALPFNLSVTGL